MKNRWFKLVVILFLALIFTFLLSSLWNKFIFDFDPGHTFFNRGYPLPFVGVSDRRLGILFINSAPLQNLLGYYKVYYLVSFIFDWLFFAVIIYFIGFLLFKPNSKKKQSNLSNRSVVTVGFYHSRLDAELAQSRLRSRKIKSEVDADDVGGLYSFPFLPKPGTRLLVNRKDSKKAKKILIDLKH